MKGNARVQGPGGYGLRCVKGLRNHVESQMTSAMTPTIGTKSTQSAGCMMFPDTRVHVPLFNRPLGHRNGARIGLLIIVSARSNFARSACLVQDAVILLILEPLGLVTRPV